MTIATYSDLQTALQNWMARSDISSVNVKDAITLGEAMLNRRIPAIVTDVTLTGTLNNRRISISASSVVEAYNLWLVDTSTGDETPVTKKQDGTFAYTSSSDEPTIWATDENNTYIDFNCPLNAAYTFRLRCKQRFALSDSSTTNWLLTNHPDVYLAASIVWGGMFTGDGEKTAAYAAVLGDAIPSIIAQLSRQNNAVLTVDPALLTSGPMTYSQWANG